MKEFKLSEKVIQGRLGNKKVDLLIDVEDVKEFIKLLKEEFIKKFELSNVENIKYFEYLMKIDKLAGSSQFDIKEKQNE